MCLVLSAHSLPSQAVLTCRRPQPFTPWNRILSLVLVITVSAAMACSREQQIDGHSMAYWERSLKSPDPTVRAAAARRFVEAAPPSTATAQVLV